LHKEKENLLGGVEFHKQKIIEIVKEENNEYDELKIKILINLMLW
jgi:hypothetical protein